MGRRRIGGTLDIELLVEDYVCACVLEGEPPLVKRLATGVGLTAVTLSRRYLEATGRTLALDLRRMHGEYLHDIAETTRCLERVAERGGYSCGRSVRRRLKAIGAALQRGEP